ncbi:tol-pal system protein YbgF [Psychrobium sp. 1_MG-2023]|uniref:tol-pal system protein YbgF n=1 Tax=Psychrobium sp. 1_MG-2023 TaxID=3062624 RepID=UPI000C326787|nr:tol-pal system protein YbgF [Psychrobium sp. 1_MG-2023]MDP2560256.1 tol-pal system protein YbgF [Psychrobium sp. 1_MG-2023]PKF57064.1 tol-pal system protein YbgF [Alteromonadales bacterium alter-6D02]
MKNLITLGLFLAASTQVHAANVVELNTSPEQRIASLEQMIKQKNRVQVEMQQHIDTLQQELNELRGTTETQDHRLNQVLQRQRELYQELDKLATRLETASLSNTPIDTSAQAPALSESEAYDRALNLVLKGKQYDKAIVEFERYLTDFPQSTYLANVHYWLGQLLFTKGKSAEAKIQFETLVTNFEQSSKRSDALVKLGKIAQDSKNAAQAKTLYQKVVKEYPDSSAAQIARTRLKSL